MERASQKCKCKYNIFALIYEEYDNQLLNNPKLFKAFQVRYGMQNPNNLIALSHKLVQENLTFQED